MLCLFLIFELSVGEHVECLVDVLGVFVCGLLERFVDGVFDCGGVELGMGGTQCVVVDIDQVLVYLSSIY